MNKSEIKSKSDDKNSKKSSVKNDKNMTDSNTSRKKIKINEKYVDKTDNNDVETIIFKNPDKSEQDEKNPEVSIEQKLIALYSLQQIDSEIDKIKIIRGELPLEVQDLEDEIAGLETRIENLNKEIEDLKTQIAEKQNAIVEHKSLIKKYETQLMNVRNNREYDAIKKEIEYQDLEIQLCEKRIKEYTASLEVKNETVAQSIQKLDEKKKDFVNKKKELVDIINETEKEESKLKKKSIELQSYIEPRLLNAYTRIRQNARNGLAIVLVERDACGGCFSKIPPQRQLDIRMHKKIIVCEYCGRILIDNEIAEIVNKQLA